jgi:hypothetical protein
VIGLVEVLRVDPVHGDEVLHVGQEDRRLHHGAEIEPGRREHTPQVQLNALDELTGLGIQSDLAGGVHHPLGFDRLRVGADGPRSLVRADRFHTCVSLLSSAGGGVQARPET